MRLGLLLPAGLSLHFGESQEEPHTVPQQLSLSPLNSTGSLCYLSIFEVERVLSFLVVIVVIAALLFEEVLGWLENIRKILVL